MTRTPHILVVDDDTKIRNGFAKLLSEQGLRVTAASDGKEMFEKLAGARVDLDVLDIMLPGQDGLTLLRRLRAESAIPVILLTALAGETDRIVGLDIGAEDYICNPDLTPRRPGQSRPDGLVGSACCRDLTPGLLAAVRRFGGCNAGPRPRNLAPVS